MNFVSGTLRSRRRCIPLLCVMFIVLPTIAVGGLFSHGNFDNGKDFESFKTEFKGYHTEPTIWLNDFDIQRIPKNRTLLAPGYLFINDMINIGKPYGFGQSIYTEDGDLVWQHREHALWKQNLHVCDYMGHTGEHLCFYSRGPLRQIPHLEGPKKDPRPETTYGRLVVLNKSYKHKKTHNHTLLGLSVNGHAFATWDNGTKLTTIAGRPRLLDLSSLHGRKKTWVLSQCIQELDMKTGKDTFHWCYIDNGLPLAATYTFEGKSDKALSHYVSHHGLKGGPKHQWDFMHANSVAKTEEGDYIMSARLLNQLIKVAGNNNKHGKKPGELIWRLGGKWNDFKFVNFNDWNLPEGFSRQHDVRSHWVNGSRELLSIFNNAYDHVYDPSQPFSEGQIIEVDTDTMVAKLVRSYPHPFYKKTHKDQETKLSDGRGNMQVLPNKNVLIGWGTLPHFTEYDKKGNVLYHVKYKRPGGPRENFSYRIFRFPWVGKPHWKPKLIAFAEKCANHSLVAYVSWNGATEVKKWKFSTADRKEGPWQHVQTVEKKSFETKVILQPEVDVSRTTYVSVEALDKEDKALKSKKAAIFVPKPKYITTCGKEGCHRGFDYSEKKSMAKRCDGHPEPPDRHWAGYGLSSLIVIIIWIIVTLSGRDWRRSLWRTGDDDRGEGYEKVEEENDEHSANAPLMSGKNEDDEYGQLSDPSAVSKEAHG